MATTLDIDLLRTFHAVVRIGKFSAAAEQLHKSPAAVSVQIQRLEAVADPRGAAGHSRPRHPVRAQPGIGRGRRRDFAGAGDAAIVSVVSKGWTLRCAASGY